MSSSALREVMVWDPFVRIAHWALVAAFAVAYLTEDDLLEAHVWAGYLVGAIVVFRVVWGFVGPSHARFSEFARGPTAAIRYVRDLLLFKAQRHLGHSPAGGAMIVALLLSLSGTVGTGLAVYGAEKHAGPLRGLFAEAATEPVATLIPAARAEEGNGEQNPGAREGEKGRRAEFLGTIHELFANLTLVLIALHVAGVLLASVAHRENLVWAIITGRKRTADATIEVPPRA